MLIVIYCFNNPIWASANGIWNSIHALKKSVYDPSIKLNKQFDTEAQKKSQVDYYVLRKLYFCTIIVD